MNEKFKSAATSLVANMSDWFEINLEIRLFGVRVFSFTWPPKNQSQNE